MYSDGAYMKSTFEEIILERIRYHTSQRIDIKGIHSSKMDINEVAESLGRIVSLDISYDIWGQTLEPKEIKYPANWFESLKERWAPRKWLKHYPVKYTKHEIALQVLYPNFQYACPNEESVVKVFSYDCNDLWVGDY